MIKRFSDGFEKEKELRRLSTKLIKKYPDESFKLDEGNINDVTVHYDYLLEHDNIILKISH